METLRDQIAPELRAMGFKGSGQKYRLPSTNGDHALLGFQSWRYNQPERARFTANVAFSGVQEWENARRREPRLDEKPAHNVTYRVGWEERIGFLLSYPHDHWWAIRQDPDEAQLVARDVVAVVRADVLPQLTARLRGTEAPPTPEVIVQTSSHCPWPYCDSTGAAT